MTDQEAFEVWVTDHWEWPAAAEKDSEGDYLLSTTAVAWGVWQCACDWRDRKRRDELVL